MKILDSDHCIAILRGKLDLQTWVSPTDLLAVTTISVGELTHGAHKSAATAKNLARVDLLLSALQILPFDAVAARRFGWLKADLEAKGMGLATADLQIASIALAQQIPVVTHNQKHFNRVPGLKLEDWLE